MGLIFCNCQAEFTTGFVDNEVPLEVLFARCWMLHNELDHVSAVNWHIHFCYKDVLKCDLITYNSLQKHQNNTRNGLPILKIPRKWCHSWLYYFWFSSYDSGLLRKAAILDLSNMAATAGAQLGSLGKLACYDHIYPWSKIGACRTI